MFCLNKMTAVSTEFAKKQSTLDFNKSNQTVNIILFSSAPYLRLSIANCCKYPSLYTKAVVFFISNNLKV